MDSCSLTPCSLSYTRMCFGGIFIVLPQISLKMEAGYSSDTLACGYKIEGVAYGRLCIIEYRYKEFQFYVK
jgi:hypothetical protein